MIITVIKAIAIVIILSFISGCDLLTDSNMKDEPSVKKKDIQLLKSTTWVSLTGQEIAGRMPDTESWYTFGFYKHFASEEFDSMMGGSHFYTYNDLIMPGNYYLAEYKIDGENNIKLVEDRIVQTEALTPVYENFSFCYINDWYIQYDRLFILYPYTEKDEYILEFEMLTENHRVASLFESQWPYQ